MAAWERERAKDKREWGDVRGIREDKEGGRSEREGWREGRR